MMTSAQCFPLLASPPLWSVFMQSHAEAQARIRQGNKSFSSDAINAGMTDFRRIWALLLTYRLAASEACRALEQHRTTHRYLRKPEWRSDALRPRN